MSSEQGDHPGEIAPRSFRFLLNAWLIFAFYSAYKGMKAFRWPQPLSYRGMTVILLAGIVVYIAWRLTNVPWLKRWWAALLEGETAPPVIEKPTPKEQVASAAWFALGLCFLGGALVWLEYREPFFFAQDDNLSQFLPVILQGCQTMFSTGELATYNPHQFAGAPTASIGTYALTYPGTYLSYAIAKYLLGAPAATIDVFCVLHLVYGYPVLFALLKRMGCGNGISTAGALSFLLQGFFLINGRSWFYMTPTALWVPCLFLLAERLRQGQASRFWSLGAGLAIGAYFHSGNVQMWVYGVALWLLLLAIWIASGKLSRSAIRPIFAALLVGLGVALPLFAPQFFETSGARRIIDGASIDWTIGGLFLPWPLFKGEPAGPALFGTLHREYIGQFMYSGTTFMLFATFVALSMIVHRWTRKTWGENAHAPVAFIALVAGLGQMGLIWYVMSKLPIFSKFAHPFKFLPFLTFSALLAGAVAVERLVRKSRKPRLLDGAIALVTIGLLAYHVWLPLPSAFTYGFTPFPPPFDSLKSAGAPQRVIALAPYRHGAPLYGRMPVNNLPTEQGLYAIAGYDPIVMRREPALGMLSRLGHVEEYNSWGNWIAAPWRERPLTDEEKASRIAALRAYGVDTVFSFGASLRPPYEKGKLSYIFYHGDQYLWQMLEAVRGLPEEEKKIVSNTPWGVIYRISGADPLAFLDSPAKTPQKIRFTSRGAVVELGSQTSAGDRLIINVIDEPGKTYLRATIDGAPAEIETDEWKRVRLTLPGGAKKVELQYEPPFLKWLSVGAVFLVMGSIVGAWKKRRQ